MTRRKSPDAERLSVWRKRMGMTQAELGGKLGASRDVVARWETGAGVPLHYIERLKELGFLDAAEAPGLERIRMSKQSARMLVSILSDCSINEEIRESAKRELWKALHLDTDTEFF